MEYNKYPLDLDKSYSFIEDCLDCGKAFANKVLSSGLLVNCQVHTYVPTGFNSFYDFDTGVGIADWDQAYKYYISYIREYLFTANRRPLVIMENSMASKDDLYMQNILSKKLTIEKDVYILLTEEDKDIESIKNAYDDSANVWLNITLLTSLPDAISFGKDNILDDNSAIVNELAQRVRAIIIDAYDGDSFIYIKCNVKI